MGEMRNAYKILTGNLEGKRPLGRHKHRWEDNTRRDLTEIGCEDVDWSPLAQDRDQWWVLENTVMNVWVP
jgi:hypothetical protein